MKAFAGVCSNRLRILISVLLVLATIGSITSWAQSQKDSGVDVHYHTFQPKVAPDAGSSATVTQAQADAIVAQQIALLEQDKDARNPALRKMDSNLIYTVRMMQGLPAAPGIPFLYTGVTLDDNDNVVIDIVANVTDMLLKKLATAGAQVLYQNAELRSIRAVVSPNQIEGIAASPDVVFVWPKQGSDTHRVVRPAAATHSSTFDEREARVRRALRPFTQGPATIITGQGSVESEGDITHRAFDARGVFGVNGAGLNIGVLSDGVTSRALSQATGDLPPTCPGPGGPCLTVLAGQAGAGDEGTAMLEIIHDMVPGANLFFATADNSITSFAANIRTLQTAGCQIIVDDVFYFVESPFQDGQTAAVVSTSQGGVVTQAVNDVVALGAFYFSAAGDEGGLDAGTSGTFEGDFVPQASASPLPSGNVHNFGSGNGFDTITSPGEQVVGLYWADPLGGSGNDYDLYLLNSTGASILGASTNIQSGTQDPVELIGSANVINNNRIVVFQHTGAADRFFHLVLYRGRLAVATSGETHGHSAASGAYTVVATPAATSGGTPTPNGPFPGPFTSASQTEISSSDGLRHNFFNADSTAITPGDFSATGGIVLNKPDIAGADGVSVTGVGGFGSPLFGTSAAAPSAAGVAALVLSAVPGITPAQMRTALTGTAIDIMASGFDRDSGNGIVMAYPAILSLGVAGQANPEILSVVSSQNPGNGDGIIKAGEGAAIVIQLQNTTGVLNATGITATLATTTPGVTVTLPGTSAYANIAAGATGGVNLSPFTITLASNFGCASVINFTLTVSMTTGGSNKVLAFSIPVNTIAISNTLGTLPPTAAGVTTATGAQVNRINRNGVISVCGVPKAFPGAITGAHTFDSYTFTPSVTGCAPFGLNAGAAGMNLFEALYVSPYDPAAIGTNYAGDAGLSSNIQTCSVTLTAGTSYTLVVTDVAGNPLPPPALPNTYSIQIPACVFQATINQLPIAIAQNVTVTATTFNGTANANINNGSSDPDGGPLTITQTPPGPYPIGVTTVLLTVVDNKGATAQASATVTVVNLPPDLTITKSHVGNFVLGQMGAQYTITVSNLASASPTVGTVTVVDTLPAGMAAISVSGTGWACVLGTLTCTRSDVLAPGASYPAITLRINLLPGAATLLTNTAVVSGGGETNLANDTAADPTTVSATDFSISASPSIVTVTAGQTATYTITLTPDVGGFPNAVTLTQTGAPTVGTIITFNPASVTPNVLAQTSTFTITTTARGATPFRRFWPRPFSPLPVILWLLSAAILLATFLLMRRLGHRRLISRAGIAAAFVLFVIGVAGCSAVVGNLGGTPAGNYTITITGTSGGVVHQTSVMLTVN
jgi:uncharacterized repeat protein (TIGR01451 family)